MPFVIGETIGPYRITEQLGQGGMATVFKAYHAALDRYVAIKALHPAFKEDPNFLARFQREARVVARLDQPNIVPIYDFAEHEGRPYLVMKYIEGETLKARLAKRSLSSNEILRVVESVGAALTFAHRQGILHRDIKPSNVLLANDGQIYLADFGLARIAAAGESTMSSDMMLGTPQYISPEQALGKSELDEGTDIYSFGVLLYELLVGKVPFSADTPYAIIHDHIYSPLPLPRSINPHISEEVERVLLKALAKERADRYPAVQALVEAYKAATHESEAAARAVVSGAVPAATAAAILPETRVSPTAAPGIVVPEHATTGSGSVGAQIPEQVDTGSITQTPTSLAPAMAAPGIGVPEPATPGLGSVEEQLPGQVEIGSMTQAPTSIAPASAWEQVTEVAPALLPGPEIQAESASTVMAPTVPKAGPAHKPIYKRWYVWLVVAVGVLGLGVVVWFGIGWVQHRRETAQQTLPNATQVPVVNNVTQDQLKAARLKVDQNPGDPIAHLDLAVLLIEAQKYGEASDELNKVEGLAKDYQFYIDHGKLYREQQHWIVSAWAFMRAMELNPNWRDAGALDLWHEAIYKAFNNPDAGQIINLDRISVLDAAIAGVARAEAQLAAGNPGQAEGVILQVTQQNENFPEALLVQARVMGALKRVDRAKKILANLKSAEILPAWIRDEINRIETVENLKP